MRTLPPRQAVPALLAAAALVGLWLLRPAPEAPPPAPQPPAPRDGGMADAGPGTPPAPIRGWVADDLGEPVVGARVLDTRGGEAVTTDRAGHFRLPPAAHCPCDVEVAAPHHASVVARGVAANRALQLVLERTATLTGVVLDAEGSPAADAELTVAGGGLWPARESRTGPDGRFEVKGLPGGLFLARARADSAVAVSQLPLSLEPGRGVDTTLRLRDAERPTGTVTDAGDGKPIAAAEVRFVAARPEFPPDRVTTGEDGVFVGPALAPGKHGMEVAAAGYVGRRFPPGVRQPTRVRLRRAATLRGRVTDGHGTPVSGVEIEITGRGPGGEFRLGRVFSAPGPVPTGTGGDNLGVIPGPVPPIPLVPGGGLPPTGSPPRPSQAGAPPTPTPTAPEAGAAAPAAPERSMFETGPGGNFEITGVPSGRMRLLARHPDYAMLRTEPLTLRDGARPDPLALELGQGFEVSGVVVDANDEPVPGARITMEPKGSPGLLQTMSQAEGRFRIPHAEGAYSLEARLGGGLRATSTVRVDGPLEGLRLRLPGAGPPLVGRILDDRGFPVAHAVVRVTVDGDPAALTRSAVSNEDGAFELRGLPPDRLTAEVLAEGRARTRASCQVGGEPVEIRLPPASTLRGRVATPAGPLPGVTVRYRRRAGHDRGVTLTNMEGSFEVRQLNAGSYELILRHQGFVTDTREVAVRGPDTAVEVSLSATGSVAGQVVDALGAPVFDATVAAGDPPDWQRGTRTDHDGAYLLAGLIPGERRLAARHVDGGEVRLQRVTRIRGGERAVAEVLRLPGKVTGPGPRPEAEGGDREGVAATVERQGERIVVTGVVPGSGAARAGLRRGDVVVSVEGEQVFAAGQVRSMWRGPAGSQVTTGVARGGGSRRLRLPRERH